MGVDYISDMSIFIQRYYVSDKSVKTCFVIIAVYSVDQELL